MSFLEMPDTPICKIISIVGCAWILLAIFFPVVVGLLAFAVIVGIAGLITGGIATIIRAMFGG